MPEDPPSKGAQAPTSAPTTTTTTTTTNANWVGIAWTPELSLAAVPLLALALVVPAGRIVSRRYKGRGARGEGRGTQPPERKQ